MVTSHVRIDRTNDGHSGWNSVTTPPRFGTPEDWRAHLAPAISARSYKAITRRVAEWAARDYVTDEQRRQVANLILRYVS